MSDGKLIAVAHRKNRKNSETFLYLYICICALISTNHKILMSKNYSLAGTSGATGEDKGSYIIF